MLPCRPSTSRPWPHDANGGRHRMSGGGDGLQPPCARCVATLEKLIGILENRLDALGVEATSRYTARPDLRIGLVDEPAMAHQLGISIRTLARYRREGHLPGCWIRNGKHVRWRTAETLAAWQKGTT